MYYLCSKFRQGTKTITSTVTGRGKSAAGESSVILGVGIKARTQGKTGMVTYLGSAQTFAVGKRWMYTTLTF